MHDKTMNEEVLRAQLTAIQKKLINSLKEDTSKLEKMLAELGNNKNPNYEDLVEIVKFTSIITIILSSFIIKDVTETLQKEELQIELDAMLKRMEQ